MVLKFSSLFVLVAILLAAGCVQPVSMTEMPPASAEADGIGSEDGDIGGYVLRPLDPIYIRFSGIQEQQQLDLVIDEQGEISLLHIEKPIQAAGLTTSQLEYMIERLYIDGGIYKNVSVNVTMTAKVFYVQGEVNAPGQYPLQTGTTLLQAIAGARGPTAFANLKKVTIARQGRIYTFDVRQLEKDPSQDVKIKAGDVIKVWQTWY
jgi:polysaccharide export outer membrane protein